MSRISRYY